MAPLLLGLGGLLIGSALHPFVTYPLSLALARRFRRQPLSLDDAPPLSGSDMSICMCAYNEERVIEQKIENLLALQDRYPGLELNVYVDGASDRTAELLRPHADRIRLILSEERHGKTHGMNRLVAQASRPLLVFTDANVTIALDALDKLARYFGDERVGCVCSHLQYTNGGDSVTASSGSLYWRLDEWIKRMETDTGSAMGADGSLFAIRRELHRAPPDDIIDDMFVSFSILCAGYRVVQADDVHAYEESVTVSGEEFRRKVRIACQAYNVHRLLWPRLRKQSGWNVYKYVSHKWMRWLTIYFLLGGATLLELGLLLGGQAGTALALLAVGGGGAIAGHFGWVGRLAQLWDIFVAFAGTGLGVLKSIQGARFQTWTPAASIRK